MQALTPRQKAIYDYIVAFREEHGCSPSIPELQRAFLIRSPNGVACHLLALEAKGYIRRSKRGSRQIDIVAGQSAEAGPSHLFNIPVLPRPLRPDENPRTKANITVDTVALGFRPPDGTYALVSRDDTMRFAGILPGDIVVVEPERWPRPGRLVVVLVPGGYMIRRLVHSGGRWYLRSEHSTRGKSTPRARAELAGVIRTVIRALS